MPAKDLKAIFFDFDGVIADTPRDNYAAWVKALQPYAIEISDEEYYLYEGAKTVDFATMLLERAGLDSGAAQLIADTKDSHYQQQHSFKLYPEVPQLLANLKEVGIKLGLVSGGKAKRILGSLDPKILALFDTFVAADDCTRGKPDPEPYLRAATNIGLSPSQCLVVENAPLGVKSAKNARMTCIAITSTLNRDQLKQADFVIDNLSDIYQLISMDFQR